MIGILIFEPAIVAFLMPRPWLRTAIVADVTVPIDPLRQVRGGGIASHQHRVAAGAGDLAATAAFRESALRPAT